MKIIVGLGNPGKKYEKTRHNAGFLAIDAMRDYLANNERAFPVESRHSASYEAYQYEWQSSGSAEDSERLVFLKPLRYMNRSGEVLAAYLRTAKHISIASDVCVVHDELALPLGRLKIDRGSSAAGHNGVQNCIDHLKTKDFVRFRMGIGGGGLSTERMEDFVLQKFTKNELNTLKDVFSQTCEALEYFFVYGLEKTQSRYNAVR
jgi:peptidyl-tRNA hydrolase, PTH1 family